MDRKQFAIFASALKTYYPREKLLQNNQAMELWFQHLKDLNYAVAETALQAWVNKSKWAPTIADIRSEVKLMYWQALENAQGDEFTSIYHTIKELDSEKQIQDTGAYTAICQS